MYLFFTKRLIIAIFFAVIIRDITIINKCIILIGIILIKKCINLTHKFQDVYRFTSTESDCIFGLLFDNTTACMHTMKLVSVFAMCIYLLITSDNWMIVSLLHCMYTDSIQSTIPVHSCMIVLTKVQEIS